jgi:hypothetical protein
MTQKIEGFEEYETHTVDQVYTRSNPPIPWAPPDGITPDQEPFTDEEGNEGVGRSWAEVILSTIPDGFVKDMVLALRGHETPTLFCIWGALFAISSVLQRRAYIEWGRGHLYPNLYLLFIAPPGVAKKSTSILYAERIIDRIPEVFIKDADMEIFSIPVMSGKVTPEGMINLLEPKTIMIQEEGIGEAIPFNLGSRLAVVVDELTVFLGKQNYNVGMTERLTNLYDCKSKEQIYTKKDGMITLKNVFFNLFGGTTPDAFNDTMPYEARGGGLLSRFVIAYQENTTREFARPQRIPGLPDDDEMVKRLAWVSRNRGGEYDLTPEALEEYEKWYTDFKEELRTQELTDGDTRRDVLLIKTAALIAAQKYEPCEEKKWITKTDMVAAMALIEEMRKHKLKAEGQLGDTEWMKRFLRIEKALKKHHAVTKQELVRWMSRYMSTAQVDEVLETLIQGGKVEAFQEGKETSNVTGSICQAFVWKT